MKAFGTRAAQGFGAGLALMSLALSSPGWAPSTNDLDAAVNGGDFTGYFANASAWLNQQVPPAERITGPGLEALLKDAVFANTLSQRQFITKIGAGQMEMFARAGERNKEFLKWLLRHTEALDLCLEGATPTGLRAREQSRYALPVSVLQIWKGIFEADPDSKQGLDLKLAIATALAPPGSGNHGAGQREPFAEPVARYQHYKTAHRNKELFPSFDHLTVWEYCQVVSSCASDGDLAWAREMINTWRPDLRKNEQVVNSTSEVWYRTPPFGFTNGYPSVIAAGGKCGPRSSWAVMICQAFGIPAIGVSQPGHACVAYKAANPSLGPQPGSAWKVGYGRGWQVSRLEGMAGPEFLAGVAERLRVTEFSQVEHLRWIAAALASKEQAGAVMSVARAVQRAAAAAAPKTDITASARAAEAEKELPPEVDPASTAMAPATKPEALFQPAPGVIHIEAESFAGKSGVGVYDCYTGGKQVNFPKNTPNSWIDYAFDVPGAGIYALTMRTATPNFDQVFSITSGAARLATVNVPNTQGLWGTTEAVDLKLDPGRQTLRVSAPYQRGVAVRWLELKEKGM